MLAMDRQLSILRKVQLEGSVSVTQLAKELDVTSETIRRDIKTLSKNGEIVKTHGGAMLKRALQMESPLDQRMLLQSDIKKRIGAFAATLVQDNDVMHIPATSSCICMVAALHDRKNLTFITESLSIASLVVDKLKQGDITGRLIMVGGEVDIQQNTTVSIHSDSVERSYFFTKCFVGASALGVDGPMIYSPDIGAHNNMLMRQSEQVLLLTESAKFLKSSLCRYTTYDAIDTFVTDDLNPIPAETLRILEKSQVQLYRVSADGASASKE